MSKPMQKQRVYIPKHTELTQERIEAIRQRLIAERAANAPDQSPLLQVPAGTLVSALWSRIGHFLARFLGVQKS